ncbi:hypothetical protein Fcan01_27742 [Folsomia candida]|uniref:Uncharacterized protein n=1 Tax=Folsomia candida TaxID=158441 RepID=A0A226CY90_FOLCA|nr:hypothetical protein Fcan01_27742 [Folsomia candida]
MECRKRRSDGGTGPEVSTTKKGRGRTQDLPVLPASTRTKRKVTGTSGTHDIIGALEPTHPSSRYEIYERSLPPCPPSVEISTEKSSEILALLEASIFQSAHMVAFNKSISRELGFRPGGADLATYRDTCTGYILAHKIQVETFKGMTSADALKALHSFRFDSSSTILSLQKLLNWYNPSDWSYSFCGEHFSSKTRNFCHLQKQHTVNLYSTNTSADLQPLVPGDDVPPGETPVGNWTRVPHRFRPKMMCPSRELKSPNKELPHNRMLTSGRDGEVNRMVGVATEAVACPAGSHSSPSSPSPLNETGVDRTLIPSENYGQVTKEASVGETVVLANASKGHITGQVSTLNRPNLAESSKNTCPITFSYSYMSG